VNFTRTVETDLSYDDAVAAVKAALAEQGFGTLTEIDVRQTIKDKLDIDTDPQLIIGACNPHLAHQALHVDPRITVLLPCNVVVRRTADCTVVEALDPAVMAEMSDSAELVSIAEDAARRVQAALDAVSARR
jgi:uncharacterized protein (DUF302 family)